MLTITYSENGCAINEFYLSTWIKEQKSLSEDDLDWETEISTSIPIWAIKKEIAIGNMNCNLIQFKFNGEIVKVNKYGAILDWPKGFADLVNDLAEETLKGAMKRKKEERDNT